MAKSPVTVAEILAKMLKKNPDLIKQAARNKAYWHKRIDSEMQSIYNDLLKRNEKLKTVYQRAYENMDREVAAFIKKYGEDGVISRSEFYAFNRNLELMDNIKNELQKVGYKEVSFIEKSLIDSYKLSFKTMGDDLGLMMNVKKVQGLSNVAPVENIQRALKLNLQDKHFSERVWNNKEKALQRIQETLEQAAAQNMSYSKASEILAERMGVAFNDADRLISTEMNHIITEAQADSFAKYGIRRYEIIAVMDDRTTEICKTFDGQVFNLEEKQSGLNAPPFHVRCRSTIAPAVDWGNVNT